MRIPYALQMIWHDRIRYLPALLAVAFSALLIAIQTGVLLGALAVTSKPIDNAQADLWVAMRDVPSIELGYPIPESWLDRLSAQPEIERVEPYLYNFADWKKPVGGSLNCIIIGSRLRPESLGAIADLTPEMRVRLTEPGTVVIDESEVERLGLKHGVDEIAEISGHRVRVVGLIRGSKSIWGPYIFCSLPTARMVLPYYQAEQVQYLLAKCKEPGEAADVAARLTGRYPAMTVLTKDQFSSRTQIYWLTQTRVGISIGFAAALALVVGLIITSQTLYAATAASLRELSVLRALGIPRWRMIGLILAQAFWIGLGGMVVALPVIKLVESIGERVGAEVLLSNWLLISTAVLTVAIALVSGLIAQRSLNGIEPAVLLR